MIAPPRRPSFDPTPGMTLGDVIAELGAEAFRQELFARRVLGVADGEPTPATRLITALDHARKLLEAVAQDWAAHREIIRRRQQGR